MSSSPELEKLDEAEFKWVKKGGKGGKNKDVQFYVSFTYDGVDYALYDCVYMYKKGEPAPYIGKLVKIWENADQSKRIKVQWFFRPSEISHYLRGTKVLENELFFASGEGTGLANINLLEAIAGKCNVVCISKDSRNPQPSAEEVQMADYLFYRTFDVKSFIISDQMDDKVGGLEVKYVFNGGAGFRTLDGQKLDLKVTDKARIEGACKETLKLAGTNSAQQLNDVKHDKSSDRILGEEDKNVTLALVKLGSLHGRYSSGVDVISGDNGVATGITIEGRKDELNDLKSPPVEVKVDEGVKFARKSCHLDGAPSKRAKSDSTNSSFKVQDTSDIQSPSVPGNDAANLVTVAATSINTKPKSELNDFVGCTKDAKLAENPSSLDNKLSETKSSSTKEAPRSGNAHDAVRLQSESSKVNKDTSASQGQLLSKSKSSLSTEILESAHAEVSVCNEKDEKLGGNWSACREPSTSNVASHDEMSRLLKANVSSNETPKFGPNNRDSEGSQLAPKLVQSSSTSMKRPLKRSADMTKGKSSVEHEKSQENTDKKQVSNSCAKEERSLKKAKFSDGTKQWEDTNGNNIKKLKEKNCPGESKRSSKPVTYDNIAKSKLGEVAIKENNSEGNKLSSDKLPKPLISRSRGGEKVGGQSIEVTRRPEKKEWIKLTWEQKMKAAHDEGRLVLLQNLDPEYTSAEIEDIVWHVFNEICPARMVQQTAISSPHSGQAFVVFGTKEAADRALQILDDGCLMLPNKRPLIGCPGVLPKLPVKQTSFVGHLAIDKARRQIQRETKGVVSTSHYSQNNTIEYEMAMDWCLLQSKSDMWWQTLHKQQKQQLEKLTDKLKLK